MCNGGGTPGVESTRKPSYKDGGVGLIRYCGILC